MNRMKSSVAMHTWMAVVLLSAWLLNGCAVNQYPYISKDVEEIAPGLLEGYFPYQALPDSRELLPPPPQEGSAAYAHDLEVSTANLMLRDSSRWMQAAEDANLAFPHAMDGFNELLSLPVAEENTPYLYLLLRRTLVDASLSTYAAKSYYLRERPFLVNNQPTCTPQVEDNLREEGSYPSGHAAIGWAWALILAEVYPMQADAILLHGREFGESRVVCNVHWYSDIEGGRFMGASTAALLHSDKTFLHDLKKAKKEVKKRMEYRIHDQKQEY